MGAPWFQIRDMEETHGLVALSANFTLYGDMSDRMMSLAAGLGPTQEIYTIELIPKADIDALVRAVFTSGKSPTSTM